MSADVEFQKYCFLLPSWDARIPLAPLRGLVPPCCLAMSFNIKNFLAAPGLNYVHHSSSSVVFVVLCRSSCLRFLNICSVSSVFLLGDRGTPNARPPTAVDLRSPIMSNEKVIKVSTSAFIFFCCLFTFAYLLLRVKNVCFVLKKKKKAGGRNSRAPATPAVSSERFKKKK